MGFRWIDPQAVASDDGFVLRFTGKSSMEYQAGKWIIRIHIEDGYGEKLQPLTRVFVGSITHWRDGFQSRRISERERKTIVQNIREALAFQGLGVVLS